MHHRWHPAPNRLRRADRAASRATARRAVSAAYHRQPHVGRQAGFTLIEVCLATFVMIFGIATSLIVMQTGFKALDVARDSTLASQIMQSEIERIRLLPWNNTSTTAVDSICELPASETVALSTMFTANAMDEHLVLAAQAGANHHISKPITPARLLHGIELALSQQPGDDETPALRRIGL